MEEDLNRHFTKGNTNKRITTSRKGAQHYQLLKEKILKNKNPSQRAYCIQ